MKMSSRSTGGWASLIVGGGGGPGARGIRPNGSLRSSPPRDKLLESGPRYRPKMITSSGAICPRKGGDAAIQEEFWTRFEARACATRPAAREHRVVYAPRSRWPISGDRGVTRRRSASGLRGGPADPGDGGHRDRDRMGSQSGAEERDDPPAVRSPRSRAKPG